LGGEPAGPLCAADFEPTVLHPGDPALSLHLESAIAQLQFFSSIDDCFIKF
jgi:hypothetical protein